MTIDPQPTAAASYRRTLVARGCPPHLAAIVGEILAQLGDGKEPTPQEKALIARAYAHLRS